MAKLEQAKNYLIIATGVHGSAMFDKYVEDGQRIGQAFCNVLWMVLPEQYSFLRSCRFDPFYIDLNLTGAIDLLIQKFPKTA